MKRIALISLALAAFASVFFLGSCSDSSTDPKESNLKISVTDSPFPIDSVASAYVTIDRILIKQSGEADNESYVTVTDKDVTVNLLELRNGITTALANTKVAPGTYKRIRIYVSSAKITLTNGTEYKLDIPPDKIEVLVKPEFTIDDDSLTELIIDFNLDKSFVVKGSKTDIKGFTFKPVIRAVNLTEAGAIQGVVKSPESVALKNAVISFTDGDGNEISTLTNKNGTYKIIGVPPGTYTVTCYKEGYSQKETTGVAVTAGAYTTVDFTLTL